MHSLCKDSIVRFNLIYECTYKIAQDRVQYKAQLQIKLNACMDLTGVILNKPYYTYELSSPPKILGYAPVII